MNPRQAAFARLIVQGSTQGDAYRAIYQPNCKQKQAGEEGCRLANSPVVIAEIQRLRNRQEVKTLLTLNERLQILARDAQLPGESPAMVNARARVVKVYSEISGDHAPTRTEHTGPDGAPIPVQATISATVAVTRMSVRDRIKLLQQRRANEKASREGQPT